jgi:DNA repair exonuclease SbcCD ATPase subunit
MSEIAVREQEELNEKISDLEHELEAAQANGASASAGAALDQKKKIEAIQAESEVKLKKNEAKLEKMAKQLEEMKTASGDQASELAEFTAQVASL